MVGRRGNFCLEFAGGFGVVVGAEAGLFGLGVGGLGAGCFT